MFLNSCFVITLMSVHERRGWDNVGVRETTLTMVQGCEIIHKISNNEESILGSAIRWTLDWKEETGGFSIFRSLVYFALFKEH